MMKNNGKEQSDNLYIPIDIKDIIKNKSKFIKYNIAIMQLNKDGTKIISPIEQIEKLYSNLKSNNIPSLFVRNDYKKIFEKDMSADVSSMSSNDKSKHFASIDTYEKLKHLENIKRKIKDITRDTVFDKKCFDIILDVSSDINIINQVTVLENIKTHPSISEFYKKDTVEILKSVKDVIKGVINIFDDNKVNLLEFVYNTPNIDTIMHSNRVFSIFTGFILYYNNFINIGNISKIVRKKFNSTYMHYYKQIFKKYGIDKGMDKIEDVIEKSMCAIDKKELVLYGLGALLHDIAKTENIDYLDFDTNEKKLNAKKHVLNSYGLLAKSGGYPLEVLFTVAFHHEYYGNGYGVFKNMYQNKLSNEPHFIAKHAITYDVVNISSCLSLAYFPAKVLEIVDVYDQLLFNKDIKSIKIEDTIKVLQLMHSKYIDKATCLDPIIFDIFVDYIQQIKVDSLYSIRVI